MSSTRLYSRAPAAKHTRNRGDLRHLRSLALYFSLPLRSTTACHLGHRDTNCARALYATLGPGAYITRRACRCLILHHPAATAPLSPSRPNHHYYSSTSLTRLTPPFYIQYDEAHRSDWPPPRLALRDVQRTRRCQPQRHGLALQLAFEHPARLSDELASRTSLFLLDRAEPLN